VKSRSDEPFEDSERRSTADSAEFSSRELSARDSKQSVESRAEAFVSQQGDDKHAAKSYSSSSWVLEEEQGEKTYRMFSNNTWSEVDRQSKTGDEEDDKAERHFLVRDKNQPSEIDGMRTSTLSSIRAEMARRALNLDVEVGDEEQQQDLEQQVNETSDVAYTSGSTAELSEAGYSTIATLCCPAEMTEFMFRLVSHLSFVVCNEGSMQGTVAWYYCKNQTRTFAELVEETIASADGDCAWVGTETRCPERSANCPYFPDNSAHRRRTCTYRKSINTTTTTEAPNVVTTTSAPFFCEPTKATVLDFARSDVSLNNLGGMGPNTDDAERLTFQGIATYEGTSVDLVVKTTSNYTVSNSSDNGLVGPFGQISLQSGYAVELVFKLQETATGDEVTLPEFYFTLLDIDQSDNRHRERVYAEGFAQAVEEDVTDMETVLLTDGRTLFKSMQIGYTWDDPSDPLNLEIIVDPSNANHTIDQSARSVMLVFRNTSKFVLTFEVTQEEGTPDMSRNLRFTGESSLLSRCPQP
jgi:hypothetical protein